MHAAIINQGIAKKPLFPVHPVAETLPGGGLRLAWTRRARGAWTWLDSVATPLNEESESYEVRLGDSNQPIASWTVSTSELSLDEAVLDSLRATATGMAFAVHQRGNRAISDPTFLCVLN